MNCIYEKITGGCQHAVETIGAGIECTLDCVEDLKNKIQTLEGERKALQEQVFELTALVRETDDKRIKAEFELTETRLKWLCHETACKTCPCRASKTDETGRTRHLCDCTRNEMVLGHPEKNCAKFATYDDALAAFRQFCQNENGVPCDGCPYEGTTFSCMARWLMDTEKKGKGNG